MIYSAATSEVIPFSRVASMPASSLEDPVDLHQSISKEVVLFSVSKNDESPPDWSILPQRTNLALSVCFPSKLIE